MGSLFLWLVIGYYVFKGLRNVLQKVAQEHQEQMERHAELKLGEEEQEYVEEYSPQEEPIFESPFDSPRNAVVPPPLNPNPVKPVIVEGGYPIQKVLEATEDKVADTEDSGTPYKASNIRDHIREGIVMKEILDRKYF
ncbi:Uncharacterised protein [Chlamydia trachomatis]|nr:Uncharacterised protein [Chlamydia trachomatis]